MQSKKLNYSVTIHMDAQTYQSLVAEAKRQGVTKTDAARRIVKQYLYDARIVNGGQA